VLELLRGRGAMFAADLMAETRMLPGQLDDALGDLVTRGLISADGFGGLRSLIAEKTGPANRHSRRVRPAAVRIRKTTGGTGRWSLWRKESQGEQIGEVGSASEGHSDNEFILQWAWQLLRRWGVVFRDLLVREPGAPSWFDLLQVYRRMEARGEIRGGRFLTGVAGEQFALGDTVRQLRRLRDEGPKQELIIFCAADPLNLVGILTDQARVPRTASNRIAYLDGIPVAALQAGEVRWFGKVPENVRSAVIERFGFVGTALPTRNLESAGKSGDSESSEKSADSDEKPSEGKKRRRRRSPSGIPRPMIS